MTPEQFLAQIRKQPAPAYLFLGPETYQRDRCRRALIERVLAPEAREDGYSRHDLDDTTLAAVLDDARSLSLFASERLIWVGGAEAALPRGKGAAAGADDEEGSRAKPAGQEELTAYLKNPTPGVVMVFDVARYEMDGDDKARLDRVAKFYGAIRDVVEFARFAPAAARTLAQQLAAKASLKLDPPVLELLVDALGADAARIASEIDKLASFSQATGRAITETEIAELVPNARTATVFGLVGALGRGDRRRSLDLLDTLVREGEYLPLVLTFIGTQLRLALAAKEARASGAAQIQSHFGKLGIQVWPSRAEQIRQTVAAFDERRLRKGILAVFEADRSLRDARPDDRTVMERLILTLTG